MKLTIELLSRGDPVQAKAEIQAFLLEQPDNDLGRSLLSQITEDPKVLLGAQSYAYTIQQGETLSMLADRYLDDRFKFYALARYNGIAVPSQSEVGQVIQIPGVPRRAAEIRPRPRVAKSDDELIQQRLEAKRAATPPPAAAPKPTAVARNPARASQLRGSALELMSRGLIEQAVPLLRRALTFDPGNVVIQRDLDRAVRILGGIRPGG
ncbi:LysM domain-containing protein [Phenylobacterium sp.]|uniref:LysM peptidoglycan-binding domain-containing protein n=1 Tax=Phenylobacterium sp. TaxID=1871053 RepID=UPI00286A31CF|nr:LysM domain-containing protein [Phenylobacterium sp.]